MSLRVEFEMMSESGIQQKGAGSNAKYHLCESVCNDSRVVLVRIIHPQESKEFSILGCYGDHKESPFNICRNSNSVYSKTTKDVQNLLVELWSWVEERRSVAPCGCIIDHTKLCSGLISADYRVVWKVVYFWDINQRLILYGLNDSLLQLRLDHTVIFYENVWFMFESMDQPIQPLQTQIVIVGEVL